MLHADRSTQPEKGLTQLSASYLIASAIQVVAAALVLPLLTRVLSPEEFGIVVTGQLVTQGLVHFCGLGLPAAVGRERFEHDDGSGTARGLLFAMVPTVVGLTLLALATGPLWSAIFADVDFELALVFAVLAAAPRSFGQGAQALFRAEGRPAFFAVIGIGVAVGTQACGLAVAVATDRSATAFLGGSLLAAMAIGAIAWFGAEPSRASASVKSLRSVLHYSLPTIPHSLAGFVIVMGDRVIIERELGLENVSQYQVGYVIGGLSIAGLAALNNAWSPQILGAPESQRWPLLARTTPVVLDAACGVAAGLALLAPIIVAGAAPATYDRDSLSAVVAIVALSGVAHAFYMSSNLVLFAQRRTRALAAATGIVAAVNLVGNLYAVPRWGLVGAATVTLFAYGFWAALIRALADRTAIVPWRRSWLLRSLVPAVALTLLSLALPTSGSFLALRIALAAGVLAVMIVRGVQFVRLDRAPAPPNELMRSQ